jgi:hypothetical protein
MKDQYLKALRGKANNLIATRIALDDLRSKISPSQFPCLIASLRRACPKFVRRHCVRGKLSFSELGWDGHLEPLAIKDELTFASLWLSPYADEINSFRDETLEIQALILGGRLKRALERINENINIHGWSIWLAEMRFALVQLVDGDSERQAMNQKLIAEAPLRIASLYAQIFNDRNDRLFSFDNFFSKCQDSFPSLKVSNPMKEYLSYRALNQVSVVPESMAKLNFGGKSRRVVAAYAPQMGPVTSALTASALISEFRPRVLVMTGICGGVDDKLNLGDLIIAENELGLAEWEMDRLRRV